MARLAHVIALENQHIMADVVEATEFPTIAQLYQVTGVPKTVINNTIQFIGVLPASEFVDKVLQAGVREPEAGKP